MLGLRGSWEKTSYEEAEKPFWISLSDLMTALMVLFLVAMAVAFSSLTVPMAIEKNAEGKRSTEIETCLDQIELIASAYPGAAVKDQTIEFGPWAFFPNDSSSLSREQQTRLRWFVPEVLSITRKPICMQWLRRVVLEGFASPTGSYLHNLDLSTRRAERVLCALLDRTGAPHLTEPDRRLVGGASFNTLTSSFNTIMGVPVDKRRVDLKLEFYRLHEQKMNPPPTNADRDEVCPIDDK